LADWPAGWVGVPVIFLFRFRDEFRNNYACSANVLGCQGRAVYTPRTLDMNENENKAADKDAPRGMSDELLEGDTLDIAHDPAKEEKELNGEKRR